MKNKKIEGSFDTANKLIDKLYETRLFRLCLIIPVYLFLSMFYWLYIVYWAIPFGKYNLFWGKQKNKFKWAMLNFFLFGLPWCFVEIKKIISDLNDPQVN